MNKEKTNFLLGLTSSIAIFALIGFIVMTVAYVNKGDSDSIDDNDSDKVALNDAPAKAPTPTPSAPTPPPPSGTPVKITITDADRIRGNKNAPITIVEYSDFQCPFCTRFHATMQQVMENYPNKVRWVYRHFPLDAIHPFARKAAEASECAGDQGKFWEYADKLVENYQSINTELFPKLAKDLKLNISTFNSCLSSGKFASKVSSDLAEGQKSGVRGTPGSFINGQNVKGAVPYSTIKATIDSLL